MPHEGHIERSLGRLEGNVEQLHTTMASTNARIDKVEAIASETRQDIAVIKQALTDQIQPNLAHHIKRSDELEKQNDLTAQRLNERMDGIVAKRIVPLEQAKMRYSWMLEVGKHMITALTAGLGATYTAIKILAKLKGL